MSIDNKLKELGISLKAPPSPVANYIPIQQTGNLIYGHGTSSSNPAPTHTVPNAATSGQ